MIRHHAEPGWPGQNRFARMGDTHHVTALLDGAINHQHRR
jgi:hypothetical protein